MLRVAAVTRLVTVVDIADPAPSTFTDDTERSGWAAAPPQATDPRAMSLSALLLAVLDDGRSLTLLDDRGWTESGPDDVWHQTSAEHVSAQARVVVGPDEPYGSYSAHDMAVGHWDHLARVLERQGVQVTGRELAQLPHAVELTERLRRRLAGA